MAPIFSATTTTAILTQTNAPLLRHRQPIKNRHHHHHHHHLDLNNTTTTTSLLLTNDTIDNTRSDSILAATAAKGAEPAEVNDIRRCETDTMGKRHHTGIFGVKPGGFLDTASFTKWGLDDAVFVLRHHPVPCAFLLSLFFFMFVEYTLRMVPPSSPPYDLGFQATRWLHSFLASSPPINTLLAALNTVFVAMQATYILWTFLVEGRARPGIAALFMFTCRGVLGYSTQLPLPQDFLGSGADFPVGNVSFFLFFSGHVGGAVIASLDMRRMQRKGMAWLFDFLNFLQMMRLLGSRGHYTIDLAVGIGAGILFDHLAGIYKDSKRNILASSTVPQSENDIAAAATNSGTTLYVQQR